jgi:hypothetical protein
MKRLAGLKMLIAKATKEMEREENELITRKIYLKPLKCESRYPVGAGYDGLVVVFLCCLIKG